MPATGVASTHKLAALDLIRYPLGCNNSFFDLIFACLPDAFEPNIMKPLLPCTDQLSFLLAVLSLILLVFPKMQCDSAVLMVDLSSAANSCHFLLFHACRRIFLLPN